MRWALVAILAAACSDPPAPERPEPIVVEEVRRGCLPRPAPEPRPVDIAGPEDGCPEAWAACLDRDSLAALVGYLGAMQRWARDTTTSCSGPDEPAEPEPGDDG